MTINRSGWRVVFLILMFSAVVSVANAVAQGADATIFGQVADSSGAVLPGVTVTVTSPALQVQQMTAVTDERGEYRITPLPIGTYTVEYMLQGFQPQRREGIRMSSGFVAKLDVQLSLGGVAETVTVSGASPVVDVKTTSAGTQVQREMLESIPTTRNSFNSLLTLAAGARPDIDQTGGNLSSDVVFRAFGRTGEAWATIDGLPVTAPENDGNTGFQSSFNYGAIEEASVQTLGTSAEAPTSGIQLNVITKSGSNAFHGSAFGGQTYDWMETTSNLNDRLRSQGITTSPEFLERWDVSGDVGGRVIRDKLWFWAGGRNRQEEATILGGFYPDGRPSTFFHDQRFFSSKVSGQLSQGQQLLASVHVRTHPRTSGPNNRFADSDQIRATNFRTVPQWQTTYQFVRGNKVLSVQGGDHRVRIPVPPILTQNAAWRDDVTGYQGGLEPRAGREIKMDRWSGRATLNWYKADMGGNHDFKFGGLYSRTNRWENLVDNGTPVGNYNLRYRGGDGFATRGVPTEIRVGNNPINPLSYLGYLGLYAQDSWAVSRRLTLNLGLRYANDRAWMPEQCRVAAPREFAVTFPAQCYPEGELKTWKPVAPRMHAAFDVTGDGRTMVKGGYGRYWMMHDRIELDIFNPNARKEARYRWRDLNNNRYFDAGESDLSLTGPDFISISVPGEAYVVEGPGLSTSVPLSNLRDNPDLKEQGSDEWSVSAERELITNLGVRVTGLYVKEFNVQRIANPLRPYSVYNIPITVQNPGVDNRVGTADDPGTTLTYFDYPASFRGPAFNAAMFINDPNADASYKSFEVALNKRLSNRWQMLASYSGTKLNVPVPRNSEHTPNAEINAADHTYEWLFRTSGSYQAPWDVQVSSNLLVQSGRQYAMTISATGGVQIPSVILFAEEIGARTTGSQTVMSLGIEKSFRFRPGHRVSVAYNVLNLLNGAPDIVFPQTRAGDQFGYSVEIAQPRVSEFTLRYSF